MFSEYAIQYSTHRFSKLRLVFVQPGPIKHLMNYKFSVSLDVLMRSEYVYWKHVPISIIVKTWEKTILGD